ncbi:MAG: helix-turn-helix domain-containing protein [Bifidobacteriaceae bacterium]|jgi:excisionase family DNA binding protein|nr:helix-turn-helix domain-containing protein [Bifidobacteriaceae bacterium]
MSPVLQRDAEALHQALELDGDELSVSLSRQTVEFIAQVVDAQAHGQEVVFSRVPREVSPEDAARMLGVSRPYVRKLMDQGDLPFRMVGSHHRIAVADVTAWYTRERTRRHEAMIRFSELENELGLFE